MEEIDNINNIFDYMANDAEIEVEEEQPQMEIRDQLAALQVQSFLTLFKVFKSLPEGEQKVFEDAAEAFVDPKQNDFVKQMALATCCQLFFPEPQEQVETIAVEVKSGKSYSRPCGDCSKTPTKLVEFRTENRTEQHYLCTDCEESAKKERA